MTAKIDPKAFFDLPFENGKDITDKELKAAYDAGHTFIHIDLSDAHFSPQITLFNGNEFDAPRDKSPHIREINDTVAAFQYLQKNYNFIYQFFLKRSIRKYQYQKYLFCIARV